MIIKKICLLLGISLLLSTAVNATTAIEILNRSHLADAKVSYRGRKTARVVVAGRSVSSLVQVTHLKPDKTRREYFSPKTLAGVVIVRRGKNAWRYSPRQKAWEQLHNPAFVPGDVNLDFVLANYKISLVGSARDAILGRSTYVILAKPKRAGEPVYRVWIDKGTYLTLKTQTEKSNGDITSTSGFTALSINPKDIKPSAFAVAAKPEAPVAPAELDFRVTKPGYIPKGYKLVGQSRDKVDGHPCAHLQFSNGVNTISLFERCSHGSRKAPRVADRLPSVMTWTRRDTLFTLVADLPRAELKKIADSTR